MDDAKRQVYITAMEGSDAFWAPVPCSRLADGSYKILPDELFDDDD